MSGRRRNTVFDLTDLRLHPDGTRISQNSQASSHNLTATHYRRNQIAQDASGWGKVHKFRKRKVPQEDVESEFTNQELDLEPPSATGVGAGKATHQGQSKSKGPDKKTAKRRRVVDDYDFLGNECSEKTQANADTVSTSLPSPDLLKCIHYFASEYYSGNGMLLNVSKDYRRQRKERTAQKMAGLACANATPTLDSASASGVGSPPTGGPTREGSPTSSRKKDRPIDVLEDVEELSSSQPSPKGRRVRVRQASDSPKGRKKGSKRAENHYIDMYKVLDGSALMAIGILVQEQIAHLLQPRIPPGWEEEVQERFPATSHGPEGHADGVSQEISAVTQRGIRAFSEHSFLDEPVDPKRN